MPEPGRSRDILETLVGFPTVSRDSNLPLIDWIEAYLDRLGFRCHRVSDPTGQKAGLFARIGPDGPGGVMLSAHTDVVPTEGQDWTSDPFTLTETGGRLVGRGAADMKGYLACALRAAGIAADGRLAEPFKLAISYDEEIGCVGISHMVGHLDDSIGRPDLCIVGEPTEMALVTGHKGKTALRCTCRGSGGHSSMAPDYQNALHLAADVMAEIRRLQDRVRESGAQDPGYAVPYSTLHVGRLEGGTALNIVPDSATLDFELRALAQEAPEPLLTQLRDAAARLAAAAQVDHPEADIRFETLTFYPGLETDPSGPGVRRVMDLLGSDEVKKVSFGTEAGVFAAAGVESVVCGPGAISVAHRADEYIDIAQLDACDAFLDRLVASMTTG
ncbi:acetylornithine deacetylase [Tranquillimonas rosea]|uniref:Acetylornithine deacetylase n=1 Tax=Tranquillimonas rosea TaxID=641238 RepID=A0A1H9WPA9_9RHOB|nr:acetylornithine deacetylase [Tranquillimonas rosea]SES35752.1 acetylornithine deacetylase [Tranquillimonas rosea]